MPKPVRTYRLYTRCSPGREPHTLVAVDEYDKTDTHVVGSKTISVPKFGGQRGAHVWTGHQYKALVAHAEYLAKMIGMPKSRIWDIFDWNEG